MSKKPTILSGGFNRYGYVISENGRAFSAAGNSPHESQLYLGLIKEGDKFVKKEVGYHTDWLSLEDIEERCKDTVNHMAEKPGLYRLPENPLGYEVGKIVFSPNLNPMEAAFKCGALT